MSSFRSTTRSFLIVGAGNFGAATALALVQSNPSAQITLIDSCPFPNPRAASHDINKIIRTDYADPLYMRLMLEAMTLWRSSPLYSPFYHETGMLRVDPSDFSERCLETYKALGEDTSATWLTVDEVRRKWGGVLRDANFAGVERCYWNPQCGWAEADRALEAVTRAAIDRGVKYCAEPVQKLIIDSSSACTGIRLDGGEEIYADCIVMCTGARTAPLLAESAPHDKNIQVGGKVVATGAVSCFAKLDSKKYDRFKDVPVVKNCLKHTKGESIALTSSGILKFNCDISFTNMTYHAASQQYMSIPPDTAGRSTWTKSGFPQDLKERALRVVKNSYGIEVEGIEIKAYRMCWDATTPSHDFLISPHPHCANLYIATGGSFHGWKFLPVIGEYIVRMLKGSLEDTLRKRWAWNRDGRGKDGQKANPTYQIETDLMNLEDK